MLLLVVGLTATFFSPLGKAEEGDPALGIFGEVFHRLPADVYVHPTENYFYWKLSIGPKASDTFKGNIRFSVEERKQGMLSFAYRRQGADRGQHLVLNAARGVSLSSTSRFVWEVRFERRTVRFHLNSLPQVQRVPLRKSERLAARVADESGLIFALVFDGTHDTFSWILESSEPVDEALSYSGDGSGALHPETGFVFWIDRSCENRFVLAAVRESSVLANSYHDGPFDQLADNWAEENGFGNLLTRFDPGLKGKVDAFGNFLDHRKGKRIALARYALYRTQEAVIDYLRAISRSPNPWVYLSRPARRIP